MVRFPNGDYVMDSEPIAQRLEREYPEPSLHLDWPVLKEKVFPHAMKIVSETRPIWMPKVPEILSDRGAEYFHRTRKEWFGITLDEMLKTEGQEVERWDRVKPDGKALGDLLRESGGPYFMGAEREYLLPSDIDRRQADRLHSIVCRLCCCWNHSLHEDCR